MINNEKLKLVEGEFLPEEAKEILINIFSTKVEFHQHRNFSSMERFGKEDETAKKRIPALQEEMTRLNKMLSEAHVQNKRLIINSEINISLADHE